MNEMVLKIEAIYEVGRGHELMQQSIKESRWSMGATKSNRASSEGKHSYIVKMAAVSDGLCNLAEYVFPEHMALQPHKSAEGFEHALCILRDDLADANKVLHALEKDGAITVRCFLMFSAGTLEDVDMQYSEASSWAGNVHCKTVKTWEEKGLRR